MSCGGSLDDKDRATHDYRLQGLARVFKVSACSDRLKCSQFRDEYVLVVVSGYEGDMAPLTCAVEL
jgi:hypothetical protein